MNIPDQLPEALSAFAAYRQFCVWERRPNATTGKVDKVPVHPTTRLPVSAHDPAGHLSFEEARDGARALGENHGVGFAFTENDPFFFIDVDHALQPDGTWSPIAQHVLAMFPGAMFELSQSGTGFHLFGCYSQAVEHSNRRSDLGVELYIKDRFVALTFNGTSGTTYDWQAQYAGLAAAWYPPGRREVAEWTDEAVPEWNGPEDDDELLRKMMASAPSIAVLEGRAASFAQLFTADEALGAIFPDPEQGRAFDHSSADYALACKLAWWTGNNAARMDRFFRRSALMREKWDGHPSYAAMTIGKAISATTEWYGAERGSSVAELERPTILINGRQTREVIEEMVGAVVGANDPPRLFLRGGRAVVVARNDRGVGVARPLSSDAYLGILCEVANFLGVSPNGPGVSPKRPPRELNVAVFDRLVRNRALPVLRAVSPTPILSEDGSLIDSESYDPTTQFYYSPKLGSRLGDVPEEPSIQDACRSVEALRTPFRDMPFASETDWANFLAILLTAVLRPWFSIAPFAVLEAPVQGSGKTLLAMAVRMIVEGAAGVGTAPEGGKWGDAEWRKRITSELMRAASVVIFDNIVGRLGGPNLAALATSPTLTDRVLGGNEAPEFPNTATWIFTSNNAVVDSDFFRRCIYVRLDANESAPWKRTDFSIPDLLGYLEAHRGELLAHLYTLARYWVVQGRPDPSPGTPVLGSFNEWSRIVPGILSSVGVHGVMADLEQREVEMVDPAEQEFAEFLSAWWENFPHLRDGVTARELAQLSFTSEGAGLPWPSVAQGKNNDGSSRSRALGKALSFRKDRWFAVDGFVSYRVRLAGGSSKKGLRWRIEYRLMQAS